MTAMPSDQDPAKSDPVKRDPVRPFLGFVVFALLYFICGSLIPPVIRFLGGEMAANTLSTLLGGAIVNALALAIFEQRQLREIGLDWVPGTLRNLLLGMVLAALAALLVVFFPMALGKAHFEAIPNPDSNLRAILFTLLLFFCGAAGEEMTFRGFPLQFLMRGYGPWISILGTGALFGAAHAINPNSGSLGIVNTAGFGMLFGFALLRSRDLWFPIGMHFGWNAMLPFLGTELSGLTIRLAGYKLVWNAGDLWSGGSYGVEGSLVTSAVLVLLTLAVWKMPVHRGTLFLLDEDELASEEPPSLRLD